jgi:hypothetical protein
MRKLIIMLLLVASPAVAQVPTAMQGDGAYEARKKDALTPKITKLRGHYLGETLGEFCAAENISPCVVYPEDLSHCDNKKKLCGDRYFQRISRFVLPEGVSLEGMSVPANTSWNAWRLDKLEFRPTLLNFDTIVLQLKKKYGEPTQVRQATVQNRHGTQWAVGRASWSMPDNTWIHAEEHIASTYFYGSRDTIVTLTYKPRDEE